MEEKSKFYFTKLPSRLLKAHTLLDHVDRGLLQQVAVYHPNPCFLPVDYLTSVVLGCGEKAFYRAVYKLKMLGLIQFEKGRRKSKGRNRPNLYTFNADPSLWRLPKPLSDEIRGDYQKLGLGELEYKNEPFKHEFAFKIYFNSSYPKHRIETKNRSVSDLTGTPVRKEIKPEDLPWFERLNKLNEENPMPLKIIADYYRYQFSIKSLGTLGEVIGFNERKFLLELKDRYMQITASPPSESIAKLVQQIEDLEKNGATRAEILGLILIEKNPPNL